MTKPAEAKRIYPDVETRLYIEAVNTITDLRVEIERLKNELTRCQQGLDFGHPDPCAVCDRAGREGRQI